MRATLRNYLELPEPRLVRAAILKDRVYLIGGTVFLGGLLAVAGFGWLALAISCWINIVEVFCRRLALGLHSDVQTHRRRLKLLLAASVVIAFSFTIPGLLLVSHQSLTYMIIGFVWLFGVQLYIAGGYIRLPLFAISMSLPVATVILLAMTEAVSYPRIPGSGADMPVILLAGAFYLFSIWIILETQASGNALLVKTQKAAVEQLTQLEVMHRVDPLTGLMNRRAIDEELQSRLDMRKDNEVAVLIVDLSFLRGVNETYGHATGDRILSELSGRLRDYFEDRATLGRLSGDSFVVILNFEGGEERLMTLARKLRSQLERKLSIGREDFAIVTPIGIATTIGVPDPTVTALCAAGDNAAQRARNMAERLPCLFNPRSFHSTLSPADRRLLIEGLKTGALRPYYQPKVHLLTGQIVGLEALARWDHPRRGTLPPGAFLPDIEALGLQAHLMEAMATQVMDDLATMIEATIDPGLVSINIPELALATNPGRTRLLQILNAAPHLRGHVTLEITEDVFIAKAGKTIRDATVALRALGLRISLDDFGTGFASFNHLKQLQFDELKIDKSFIADMATDPRNEVLLQSLIGIAAGLGVSVMAEGVETEEHRHALLQMGCLAAQGYLFSPAIPLRDVMDLMLTAQTEVEQTGRFSVFAAAQPLAVPAGRGTP